MDWIRIPFTKKLSPEEISYLESIMTGFDRQLGAVAEYIGTEEYAQLMGMNRQQINAFFSNSGIREKLSEIIEYNAHDSEDFIRNFYKIGAELGYAEIGQLLRYTPADAKALEFLTKYNFDLISNVNTELTGQIREVIFQAVAEGEGYQTTMRNLLELPLQPINGISPRTRAEMIARTETARAQNTGTIQAYANYGVEMVEIVTVGDSLVCDDCIDAEDNNPHTLQEAQSLLPMHPNCYMPDTEVYTDKGWKHFNELTDDDNILSLDPETHQTRFIDYVRIIEHDSHMGYLLHVYNNTDIDFCVTLDHDVFVMEDGEFNFIKAYRLIDSNYNCDFLINHEEDTYVSLRDCDIQLIPYNGLVQCVELPEYHTLWVKRNGKTSWNGNCRCAYAPVVPDPEELTPVDNPSVMDLTES